MDTMESILQRSIDMHPSLLVDAIKATRDEDARYRLSRKLEHVVDKAVTARIDSADKAISAIEGTAGGDAEAVALMGLGPLIIAFNEACRLQCIPHHRRTHIAVDSANPPI